MPTSNAKHGFFVSFDALIPQLADGRRAQTAVGIAIRLGIDAGLAEHLRRVDLVLLQHARRRFVPQRQRCHVFDHRGRESNRLIPEWPRRTGNWPAADQRNTPRPLDCAPLDESPTRAVGHQHDTSQT